MFVHTKMQDKENKRTLINEEALLKSTAMTFGPGGRGDAGGNDKLLWKTVNFNTLLVDSFHAGRC